MPELTTDKIKELLQKDLSTELPDEFTLLNGMLKVRRTRQASAKTLFDKYDRRKLLDSEHWPANPGYYGITDPNSPVAVAVPRQDKNLQDAAKKGGAAIVGPCVTPNEGPQIMICNLVANPNLRYLILAGKDSGHLSGDAIKCSHKHGINWETGRILETKSPTSPYFIQFRDWGEQGRRIMERFQQQIEIVDLMLPSLDELVLSLITRLCIQEPTAPFELTNLVNNERHMLYDKGVFKINGKAAEPIIIKYKEGMKFGMSEYRSRAGTTIFATDVTDALQQMRDHTAQNGSYTLFESTVQGIDVVALQVVINDLKNNLIPSGYRPEKHLETDEQTKDYIEKYSTWVYLMPHSAVRYDKDKGTHVPVIPENFGYVYGSQLCAWGWQFMTEKEKIELNELVAQFQKQFKYELPSFDEILKFHNEMAKLKPFKEGRAVDQLLNVGVNGLKHCVDNNIQAYRLYATLQDPRIHSNPDPTQIHPPCFSMHEWYPRKINGKWQNDTVFFLRAHAEKAFPANANGGIMINKFTAHHAGINQGIYVHHSGCFQLYSDDIDKERMEQKRKESEGK